MEEDNSKKVIDLESGKTSKVEEDATPAPGQTFTFTFNKPLFTPANESKPEEIKPKVEVPAPAFEKEEEMEMEPQFEFVPAKSESKKVIFELNGAEHYRNRRTIKSDILKKELLASKNVQLLFVPNQYVKHYEFIRELINKFNGDLYQASLFDGYDVS